MGPTEVAVSALAALCALHGCRTPTHCLPAPASPSRPTWASPQRRGSEQPLAGRSTIKLTSPRQTTTRCSKAARSPSAGTAEGPIAQRAPLLLLRPLPAGGKSRGRDGGGLRRRHDPQHSGEARWTVPWMDSRRLPPAHRRLRRAGRARRVGRDRACASARGAQGPARPRHRHHQAAGSACTYYEDGRIRRMHIVSTAAPGYTTPNMRPGSRDRGRGAMGKVFGKTAHGLEPACYTCMDALLAADHRPAAATASTPPARPSTQAGQPASHGCVRQHRADAAILYGMVDVGTPVYIF